MDQPTAQMEINGLVVYRAVHTRFSNTQKLMKNRRN